MDVRCDKCQARYRIDDARVGPQGLAMRCGKCGNTFRATRETAQPAAASLEAKPAATPAVPATVAPRPATKPAEGATVMFAAPAVSGGTAKPAASAAVPAAAAASIAPAAPAPGPRAPAPPQKPAPSPSKAAGGPAGAVVAPRADEAAGRTMMFNAAPSLKTQPPSRTPAGTVKPLSKPTDSAGATLVFGASPAAQQPRLPPKIDAGGNATILFGKAPPALGRPPAAQVPTPPPHTPVPMRADDLVPAGAPATHPFAEDEPGAGEPSGQIQEAGTEPAGLAGTGDGVSPTEEDLASEHAAASDEAVAAGPAEAAEGEPAEQASAGHGPPRALVIGVAAALALVLLLAGVVVAVKTLGHRAPPQAAVDALADARAAAEKDTLVSLAEAEGLANAALQAAPKAHFPQAHAQLAEVEIAWADALNDQAWYWNERANRALAQGDDKTKGEAEAKATALQDAAKARLKTAFEAAAAGNKMDPKSADVALALADYYRAARSRVNQSRELKRAALLKADDARIAFVQGEEFLAQDEGAPRALEKLRAALAGSPQSARIQFRIAMAQLILRQDAEARKELLETLRLSPQHERARLAMELLAPAAARPSGEGKKE
jgi:predicted Zn finger-like uncharacterized protein